MNKKEIIYIHEPWNYEKLCDYCGISAFSHKHAPNTIPKDFVIIKDPTTQIEPERKEDKLKKGDSIMAELKRLLDLKGSFQTTIRELTEELHNLTKP